MCGVFGIRAPERDVARVTYFGLFALQHRGQESAGIAVSDRGRLTVLRDMGLVAQVFDEQNLSGLQGEVAIGHTRYSTTGSTHWTNAQPIVQHGRERVVTLGHNGNLDERAGAPRGAGRGRHAALDDLRHRGHRRADRERPRAARGSRRERDGAARGRVLGRRARRGQADRLPRPARLPAAGPRPDRRRSACSRPRHARSTSSARRTSARSRPGELVIVDETGVEATQAVPQAGAARSACSSSSTSPGRLDAGRDRGARRAREDGRAARGGGARRGRPRHARPRLGHPGRDRLLAGERDPVLRRA